MAMSPTQSPQWSSALRTETTDCGGTGGEARDQAAMELGPTDRDDRSPTSWPLTCA